MLYQLIFGVSATLKLAAFVLLACLLGACMSSNTGNSGGAEDVYQYKGKVDPLMAEPVAIRTAKLSERFKLIQARQ